MATKASTAAGRRRASARSPRGAPAKRRSPSRNGAPATKRRPKKAAQRPPAKRRPAKRTNARPKATAPRRWLPSRGALITVVLVLAALAAGYFAWFRDSSLVAVRDVQVKGVSSVEAERVRAALDDAARDMTTLHFDATRLEDAVKGFPTVAAVSADPSFPSGVAIEVTERLPAVMAVAGDDAVPVAGDGTLLRGLELGDSADALPQIPLDDIPGGSRVEGSALAEATIVGAVPGPLRPLIEGVSFSGDHGVEVEMKGAVPIWFGEMAAAREKWAAVAAVLADPHLKTFTYLDVRAPERPAVGGAGQPAPAEAVPEPEITTPEAVISAAG